MMTIMQPKKLLCYLEKLHVLTDWTDTVSVTFFVISNKQLVLSSFYNWGERRSPGIILASLVLQPMLCSRSA